MNQVDRSDPPRRGATFPRSLRVIRRRDFETMRREGRTVRDGTLRIRWRPRPEGGATRLGLAVSRRAGNAVRRNRIKRLVREAFRLNHDALPTGLDLVVSPTDPRRATDLEAVSRSLLALARRIRR